MVPLRIAGSVIDTTSAMMVLLKKGCVPMALFSILSATNVNLVTTTLTSIVEIVSNFVSSPRVMLCNLSIIFFSMG